MDKTGITILITLFILGGTGLAVNNNKTADFISKQYSIKISALHGLYGGSNVFVDSSGNALVQTAVPATKGPGLEEKTYYLKLKETELENLKRDLVTNNFLNLKTKDRTGIPDETRLTIRLTNNQGQEHKISVWEESQLEANEYLTSDRRKFDNIYIELKKVALQAEKEGQIITKVGSIILSGGCEVFSQSTITFYQQKDKILVNVNNTTPCEFFYDKTAPIISNFNFSLKPQELGSLVKHLKDKIQALKKTPQGSTSNYKLEINLKKLKGNWQEEEGYDLEPLIFMVADFVDNYFQKSKP